MNKPLEAAACAEEWLAIPSLKGQYEASSLGRIRRTMTKRILTPTPNERGYLRITAVCDAMRKNCYVHRLVMEAFRGPSHLSVDHVDEDKPNNALSNLRYCTKQENFKIYLANNIEKYKGIYKAYNRWWARIKLDGKTKHFGSFATENEAREVYLKAKQKHHAIQALIDHIGEPTKIIRDEK